MEYFSFTSPESVDIQLPHHKAAQQEYELTLQEALTPDGFGPIEPLIEAEGPLFESAAYALADGFSKDPTYLCWVQPELRTAVLAGDQTALIQATDVILESMIGVLVDAVNDPDTNVSIIRPEGDLNTVAAISILKFTTTTDLDTEPVTLPDANHADYQSLLDEINAYGPGIGAQEWLAYRGLLQYSANAMSSKYHIDDTSMPFMHFAFVATQHEYRGLGLTASITEPMYRASELKGLPIMLESSNPRANDATFEKNGFLLLAEPFVYAEAGVNELEEPIALTLRVREPYSWDTEEAA